MASESSEGAPTEKTPVVSNAKLAVDGPGPLSIDDLPEVPPAPAWPTSFPSQDETTDSKDRTMKAELKRLDRKYDEDGDKIYLERKSGEIKADDRNVSDASRYRHSYSPNKTLTKQTSLAVVGLVRLV